MSENEIFVTREHIDRGIVLGHLIGHDQLFALMGGDAYCPIDGGLDSLEKAQAELERFRNAYRVGVDPIEENKFSLWYPHLLDGLLSKDHLSKAVEIVEALTPEAAKVLSNKYILEEEQEIDQILTEAGRELNHV